MQLAPLALEVERLGYHADREGAQVPSARLATIGDRAGTGTAAHAGRDEDHVGAVEQFDDAFGVFQRRLSSPFGDGAAAEPVGELGADLQLDRGHRIPQCLHIGVGRDEFHPFDFGLDHAVDGIAAGPADPYDLDFCRRLPILVEPELRRLFFKPQFLRLHPAPLECRPSNFRPMTRIDPTNPAVTFGFPG